MPKETSSEDSSDEESNLEMLREACDPDFTNKFNKPEFSEEERPSSMRPAIRDSPNSLEVTPEFQKHVAKHLSELLDRKLEKVLVNKLECKSSKTKRKRRCSGVKLLTNSREFMEIEDNVAGEVRTRPIKKVKGELSNKVMARLVAVEPSDILSKKEVKNWATFNKGKVYSYRKTLDGALVSTDDKFE